MSVVVVGRAAHSSAVVVLTGDGRGRLAPLATPARLAVRWNSAEWQCDGVAIAAVDLDGNQHPDLVIAWNDENPIGQVEVVLTSEQP